MAKSLNDILGYEAILGLVELTKNGVPNDVIPADFFSPGLVRQVTGKTGTYTKVEGSRKVARAVRYGAPSVAREFSGVSEQPVNLIHSFSHHDHDPATMMAIRDFENMARQAMGQREFDRKVGQLVAEQNSLRISALASLLGIGYIYLDAKGNLLPSSSSAAITIDPGIPAGHRGALDWDGTGAIIGASWATAGTDIIGDMIELKKAARIESGYPIKYAFYGENILDHLLTNTKVKELINRNQGFQVEAAAGEIPQGLFGLTWVPAYEQFYLDSAGAAQSWFGADTIAFTPEPDATWMEWIEGTYPIPTSVDVQPTADAAMSAVTEVAGMFQYAKVMDDPVGIRHYSGDTFLPVIKVPKAVFIADVTP